MKQRKKRANRGSRLSPGTVLSRSAELGLSSFGWYSSLLRWRNQLHDKGTRHIDSFNNKLRNPLQTPARKDWQIRLQPQAQWRTAFLIRLKALTSSQQWTMRRYTAPIRSGCLGPPIFALKPNFNKTPINLSPKLPIAFTQKKFILNSGVHR